MWKRILRATPALLVLTGGIACLVLGTAGRTIPVSEEQEIEVELAPPPFALPGQPGFGAPGGDPMAGPGMFGPPPFMEKVTETVIITEEESEFTLIRETTIGGVALLASGELRRLYSGEVPSLCPT
jgi:hypothetical protein